MTYVLLIWAFAITGFPDRAACKKAGDEAGWTYACVPMPQGGTAVGAASK